MNIPTDRGSILMWIDYFVAVVLVFYGMYSIEGGSVSDGVKIIFVGVVLAGSTWVFIQRRINRFKSSSK